MEEYTHKEAFCLMQYLDKTTGDIEWLWNSRDGVSPFIITSPEGNESVHINWDEDVRVPNFIPPKGMRIFVDCTLEHMREFYNKKVDEWWNLSEFPMSKMYPTKEEAIEGMLKDFKEGQPTIKVA